MGETLFDEQVITLRRGMSQAERRSTVLHECLHAERGPVPMGLAPKEEIRVRRLAAEQLLPDIYAIADALAWADGDMPAAADELWVDLPTLRDRLRFMTCSFERKYLAARFAEGEGLR
jgi:hypothetical protein